MRQKRLILSGDPEEKFGVPAVKAFEEAGEWIEAAGVSKIAAALIERRKSLHSLVDARIAYLWKKERPG